MKQLTVKELREALKKMPDDALVYLGDDDELNGIHGAWYVEKQTREQINNLSYGNFNEKGILIS